MRIRRPMQNRPRATIPSPGKSSSRKLAFCLSEDSGPAYLLFTLTFDVDTDFRSLEISRLSDASISGDLRSPRAIRLTYEGSTPYIAATRP
jgi:hypothetical protein